MTYVLAFFASLVYIALKALQQKQVQHEEYLKMPAVSLAMAFCEIFIMANVVHSAESVQGLVALALAIGLGAGIGSMLGTYLHARRRNGSAK